MYRRLFPTLLAVVALGAAACSSDTSVAESAGSAKDTGSTKSKSGEHSDAMAGMSAAEMSAHGTAPADDRGFSSLGNGEEHAPAFHQAISKADRAELARQLTLAREVALQYPTVADAEAAGLKRAGPFSPGLGAHYISFGNAASNPDGVMSDDDIRKPLAWIYDGTHQDSRIAGLFYMSAMKDTPGFAGPNDTWHLHRDICIVTGANGIDTPLGADHEATTKQCDAVNGSLIQQTQYLTHVWVVPGFESSEGVFSHLSSTITCDDGTYETIDVTKVGTKTTICVDGTE